MADDPRAILAEMTERERLVAMGHVRDPQDVPRLLAAVVVALNFHEPVKDGGGHALSGCSSCLDAYGDRAEWPCGEYAALLGALTGRSAADVLAELTRKGGQADG